MCLCVCDVIPIIKQASLFSLDKKALRFVDKANLIIINLKDKPVKIVLSSFSIQRESERKRLDYVANVKQTYETTTERQLSKNRTNERELRL